MSEEKKGFFSRLKEGLSKTRNNIVHGIDAVFSGFSSIDDSTSLIMDVNGNFVKKPNTSFDIYVFMYKDDFDLALKDYITLTGKPQMLPRYALGNWWSKNVPYKDEELL